MPSIAHTTIEIQTIAELQAAVAQAQPGQEIVLADGLIIDRNLRLAANGTERNPIIIQAKNTGRPTITATVELAGNYLRFSGLKFTGQNGNLIIEGQEIQVSNCTFFDSKARKWLRVRPGSARVEIAYNRFENKTINRTEKSCQLLQIIVRNENERHHVHHNLFKDIPPGDGNGYETIQLITEGNPFDPPGGHCNTIIEENLFIRCNGEAEIISVKSNGNLIRHNTFRACQGGLVLRHGDDNVATANFFFGENEPHSGGIRIQGSGQVVANNYFHHLGQYAVAMMDGTPDDLYIRVERALIAFNTFVDCRKDFAIGLNHSKHPNGTPPKDCQVIGNIFTNPTEAAGSNAIELVQGDQPVGWVWKDNILYRKKAPASIDGLRTADPSLKFRSNGLATPTKRTPTVEAGTETGNHAQTDLLGAQRPALKTVGALQFPARRWKKGPLQAKEVGPNAKR